MKSARHITAFYYGRVVNFVTQTEIVAVSFLSIYPVTEIIWLRMENGIRMLGSTRVRKESRR
jgi:hypothetical protein